MQFVPLWTEIIERPNWKILDLPPDLFRAWVLCLLAAQRHDHVDGRLPDERTLAHWIGAGRVECTKLLEQLILAGLIDRDDDGYCIHDWGDWRIVKDPKDTLRKRKYRAEKRAKKEAEDTPEDTPRRDTNGTCPEPVPNVSRTCPGAVSPYLLSLNSQLSSSSGGGDGVPDDVPDELVKFGRAALGERFDLDAIGGKIPGWRAAGYSDEWIRQALLVANCTEPDRLASYVNKCLRSWKARGSPDPEEVRRARKAADAPIEFHKASPDWKGPKHAS